MDDFEDEDGYCTCEVCDGGEDDGVAQEAVERGVARFDQFASGWADRIDLANFDMNDTRFCAAGQGLPGGWYDRQDALNYEELYKELGTGLIDDVDTHLGLDPAPFGNDLEDLWREAIIERRTHTL